MSRKERWKEKQRRQVKEKMDKSVRAAQIYDELTRQNEERIKSHHSSSSSSRAATKERITEGLKSCFTYPLLFAAIILASAIVLVLAVALVRFGWVKSNITFKKPVFDVYQQAEVASINSGLTQGTIMKRDILLPKVNENYAKLQCDKLGANPISIFYKGSYDAAKIGAVQETEDNYCGFPGYTVSYSYRTTYFKNLDKIAVDDKINITTSYGRFVYQVYKAGYAKKQKAFDVAENESHIVLYTDEYTGITGKKSSKYYYVFAKMISGPTVVQ